MFLRPAKLALAALLAFGVATAAHAQQDKNDQAVLPIWNNSGQIEALLVLEPTDEGAQAGTRWRMGSNRLETRFGLASADSLALLCNHQAGLAAALGNLANNCMLATLDDNEMAGGRRGTASASLDGASGSVGVTVGETRSNLPVWLAPGNTRGGASQAEGNDLTVFAQKNISDQGFVSIAGTVARARLIPYAQAPADITDRWDSKTLNLGGGYGNFRANLIGQVVETPGQPRWEGLGLGLTWRMPWSGQLTVGAENVVTRGKNPFSPRGENGEDEGTVPYVRYEQDL